MTLKNKKTNILANKLSSMKMCVIHEPIGLIYRCLATWHYITHKI